jgi:hypothetical protein
MESHDSHRAVSSFPSLKILFLTKRPCALLNRDRVADLIRGQLNLTENELTLPQVLEAATWRGGREIAKIKRPETGGPPIEIDSDGTVF